MKMILWGIADHKHVFYVSLHVCVCVCCTFVIVFYFQNLIWWTVLLQRQSLKQQLTWRGLGKVIINNLTTTWCLAIRLALWVRLRTAQLNMLTSTTWVRAPNTTAVSSPRSTMFAPGQQRRRFPQVRLLEFLSSSTILCDLAAKYRLMSKISFVYFSYLLGPEGPSNVMAFGSTTNMTVTWDISSGVNPSYTVQINNSSTVLNKTVQSIQPVVFCALRPGHLYSVKVIIHSGNFNAESKTITNATCKQPLFHLKHFLSIVGLNVLKSRI